LKLRNGTRAHLYGNSALVERRMASQPMGYRSRTGGLPNRINALSELATDKLCFDIRRVFET